jgi:hypothetical protein
LGDAFFSRICTKQFFILFRRKKAEGTMFRAFRDRVLFSLLFVVVFALPVFAQTSQSASNSADQTQLSGSLSGTIVDSTQAVIAGAHIKLTFDGNTATQETTSAGDGRFSFTNLPPGPFQLVITATGFATQRSSGNLQADETRNLFSITLAVAKADTEVMVSPATNVEVAEEQIKVEEQQRVLKVIPNFYVSYVPNAAPLIARQKFQLAWKTVIDPVSFLVIGGVAGVQQSQNNFPGYGQGAQGYAKRYAASYGDLLSGTLIGSAILPSLLKQDPRYFYKGTGSKRSRILYALANAVICKGDNGRWQTNYSGILGSLAAGGLSNLYYPAEDRNGARLTFENAAIGIGTSGALNLVEEFVVKKFTPKQSTQVPDRP